MLACAIRETDSSPNAEAPKHPQTRSEMHQPEVDTMYY